MLSGINTAFQWMVAIPFRFITCMILARMRLLILSLLPTRVLLPWTCLLEDFDVDICKASWNGRFFSIPNPHFTFTRRSKMEPERMVLTESYKRHVLAVQNETDDRIAKAHARVAAELVDSPFCRDDVDQVTNDVDLAFQFHNFVYRLYERRSRQVYQGRGIQVQDAPETDDFCFRYDTMF
jgi:hypothetical protein